MRLLRVLIFIVAACTLAFGERVAVLETSAEDGILSRSEREYITDKLRGEAGRALPASKGFVIMTRENTQVLLQGKSMGDCEGSCAVETGANLQADFVVSSRVGQYGKNLTLTVDLYEVKTNKMVGSFSVQKKDASGLLEAVESKAFALFKKVLREDDSKSKNFVGIANVVNADGQFEMTGEPYYLVEFITNPEGVALDVDQGRGGSCAETPCTLELHKGRYQVKYSKELYMEKTSTIVVERDATIRETLESNFGTVVIAPKLMSQMGSVNDLSIELDGEEIEDGRVMVVPGGHRVTISHPCYRTKDYNFNVERNGTFKIEDRMEPAKGKLVLNSDDARGTPVFVDGRQVGKIPYTGNLPVCASVTIGEGQEPLPVAMEANSTTTYTYQGNSFTDRRDGKTYKTVKIGSQVWMAENLNYSVNPGKQSWCYDNEESNCKKYGRLYTWAAAVGKSEQQCGYGKECKLRGRVQGICPSGWHLPSKEEFKTLMNAVGGSDVAGEKLKSRSGWYNDGDGTDDYVFSVFPAGYRNHNGNFYNEGYDAYLWTASEDYSGNAWDLFFYYNNGSAALYNYGKNSGFSVRCLKDSI